MTQGGPVKGPGEEAEEEADASAESASYDYLLSMPIWSLTLERVEALKEDAETQAAHVQRLRGTTAEIMWEEDLDEFVKVCVRDKGTV